MFSCKLLLRKCCCTFIGQFQVQPLYCFVASTCLSGSASLVRSGDHDSPVIEYRSIRHPGTPGNPDYQDPPESHLHPDTPGISTCDPVVSILIYGSFCTVTVYTLLKLINGITHILSDWILVHCLISNADTTGQIQTQSN